MASRSCDILLDGTYKVHISIIPKLSLIIVNELEDFGENWLEVNVIQNSTCRSIYDIRTLAGEIKFETPCRYLVEAFHKKLFSLGGRLPEQISLAYKFFINISMRSEILDNHMSSLRMALENCLSQ